MRMIPITKTFDFFCEVVMVAPDNRLGDDLESNIHGRVVCIPSGEFYFSKSTFTNDVVDSEMLLAAVGGWLHGTDAQSEYKTE